MVSQTIDAPFMIPHWIVDYVGKTVGAAQIFILTTIIGVNIWRASMELIHKKVKSIRHKANKVAEAEGEGEARGRYAVITAYLNNGMSKDQINAVIIRSRNKDLNN